MLLVFLSLTLGGSAMALVLLALRYVFLKKMPSTVYYYAWLLVLLRFILPLPGLIPVERAAREVSRPVVSAYPLPRAQPMPLPFQPKRMMMRIRIQRPLLQDLQNMAFPFSPL